MDDKIMEEINDELVKLGLLKPDDDNNVMKIEEEPIKKKRAPRTPKQKKVTLEQTPELPQELQEKIPELSPEQPPEMPKVKKIKTRKIKASEGLAKQQSPEQDTKESISEEVMKLKKQIDDIEYEEAQRLKEALEIKKKKLLQEQKQRENDKKTPQKQTIKENKNLIKTSSRDILREQYLMEAKKRVMQDLFS